jgi:hypothetical protein
VREMGRCLGEISEGRAALLRRSPHLQRPVLQFDQDADGDRAAIGRTMGAAVTTAAELLDGKKPNVAQVTAGIPEGGAFSADGCQQVLLGTGTE